MFQTSGAHTDELLYESAVLASEIDQGLSFEDTLKSLRKRLCSGSESNTESDIENLEANEKKIALGRHSEKNKGLFGKFSQFGGGGSTLIGTLSQIFSLFYFDASPNEVNVIIRKKCFLI